MLLSRRPKRSKRTPGCERILSGSYASNYQVAVSTTCSGEGVEEGATYEIFHGSLTGLIDALHELQDVVRVAVDDGHTDIVVIFILNIA